MIIAVTALKGGVGKTTTAIHIAACCQEHAPTLLIDGDRNRSALVWSKEEKLPFYVASQAGATSMISKFTHIVIDVKARPETEDLKDLAEGSDLVVLPTTPNHLDIDATLKAVDLLETLDAKYKILLTRVDSRTINGREARKTLEELELPLFSVDIPLLVAFQRSPLKGVTVKDYPDPRAKLGWSKYKIVGEEILAQAKN
ncbi:MAG: ParA family protein [Cyanobacteria bacterium J083]|nr:MAG: ParA family protein [Cyanobacteria bacterium J083]